MSKAQVHALKNGPSPVAVWAVTVTCPPCRHLMATLDQLWKEGKLSNLPVGGVVVREEWPEDMVPRFTPTMYKAGQGVYAEAGTGAGPPEALLAKLAALRAGPEEPVGAGP